MCGFVVRQGNDVSRKPLETATDRLRHRGPDQREVRLEQSRNTGLGVQRLSVLDPDGGDQPMSRDETTLVFNGEIYNYRSLRTELERSGYDFKTESDTEVLLQAYRAWGLDCLERLEGTFAVAIRDAKKDRLLLARDRMGQKPLYYSETEEGFVAASEIQALLAFPSVSRELNRRALPLYLGLQYIPAPWSGYRTIRKLPPAHLAVVEEGSLQCTKRYWTPDHTQTPVSDRNEAAHELRNVLSESVRLRQHSDAPMGLFLSGGLDSSVLAGLLAEQSESPVKTFTLTYEDADPREQTCARRVAEVFGTDHTEVPVAPEFDSVLPEVIKHHGEPFADSSILAQHWLAREAGNSITVALTGDGADELLGGYSLYRKMRIHDRLRHYLPSVLNQALRTGARIVPHRVQRRTLWDKALMLLRGLNLTPGEWYFRMMNYFQPEGMRRLFRDDCTVEVNAPLDFCRQQFEQLDSDLDATHKAMAFDVENYLAGDILAKVDTATMMNSVEGRSPYLDSKVVNLACSLPVSQKLGGRRGNKRLLREAFSDRLPDAVLNRPKQGFGIPRSRWLRGRWHKEVSQLLRSDRSDGFHELFEREEVNRLLEEHKLETVNHGGRLWALMALRTWLRVGEVRL